jgi:hypothetical protein
LPRKSQARSEKSQSILVFFSYATEDSSFFKIPLIAENLTNFPEIADVLYWEEDAHYNIITYMNENLGRCDIFIIFCSQNALGSKPVEMEWRSALKINKKIILVFLTEADIPPLLSTKLGVKFLPKDINRTIHELYELILKKVSSPADSETKAEYLDVSSNLKEITLSIYFSIFNDGKEVELGSNIYPIEIFKSSGLRYVDLYGYRFVEQNPKKSSRWAEMARAGKNILWVFRGRKYYARVVDGIFTLLKR